MELPLHSLISWLMSSWAIVFLGVLVGWAGGTSYVWGQQTLSREAEELSPRVRKIVGLSSSKDTNERIRLAQSLTILSEADRDALLNYLRAPRRAVGGLMAAQAQEFELKNEIMNRLRASPVSAQRQQETYCAMMTDPDVDLVLRDYAVQHSAKLVVRPDCSAEMAEVIVDQIAGMVRSEKGTSIAGTALLALLQLRQHQVKIEGTASVVSEEELFGCCEQLATDPEADVGSRAVAIAVTGQASGIEEGGGVPAPVWIVDLFETLLGEHSAQFGSKEIPLMELACARVLLLSSLPEDRELVTRSLEGREPVDVYVRLINQLLEELGEGRSSSGSPNVIGL